MSDKVHCDLCDAVILGNIKQLTLKVGYRVNNEFQEEEQAHDFCENCVSSTPLLAKLFQEAIA